MGVTEGECLFEAYLEKHGYSGWEKEPLYPAKSPDYRIPWKERQIYVEVKDLHQKRPLPKGCVPIDPYKGLRAEIVKGRPKFRTLKEKREPCVLAVFNAGDWEAHLSPLNVYASLLGNLGFKMDFDCERGVVRTETAVNTFLDGGQMFHGGRPWNQTISAVVVIEGFRAFEPAYLSDLNRKLRDTAWRKGKALSLKESFCVEYDFVTRYPRRARNEVRLVICENPFARVRFPQKVFRGPLDERWRLGQKGPRRVFAGTDLLHQERLSADRPRADTSR